MDHRTQTWKRTAELMEGAAADAPVEPRFESRCKVCTAGDGDLPNGAAVRDLADQLLLVPSLRPTGDQQTEAGRAGVRNRYCVDMGKTVLLVHRLLHALGLRREVKAARKDELL